MLFETNNACWPDNRSIFNMDQFASITDLAENFIAAYYPHFAYGTEYLIKFYDENSMIWRPNMSSCQSSPLSSVSDRLAYQFQENETLNVTSFTVSTFDHYVQISVNGLLYTQMENIPFVQQFVLDEHDDRLFIVSDIFQLMSPIMLDSATHSNEEIPRPQIQEPAQPVQTLPSSSTPQKDLYAKYGGAPRQHQERQGNYNRARRGGRRAPRDHEY